MSPSHRSRASSDRVVAVRHSYGWAGTDGRSVIVRGATGFDLAMSLDLSAGAQDDRAATLMMLCVTSPAGPSIGAPELDALVLGDRNMVLAELVRSTFGDSVDLRQSCSNPGCGAELEWPLSWSDLVRDATPAGQSGTEVTVDGRRVVVRAATVADERLIRRSADPIQTLVDLCVDPSDGVPTDDAEIMKQVEATLEALDPLASVDFTFTCHVCGQPMRSELDVPKLVVEMLENDDLRRADDHHILASGYGWSPGDLLDIRPADRVRFAGKLMDLWEA